MKKLLYILMFVLFTNFVSASCNGNFDILDSGNNNPNRFSTGDSLYISGGRLPVDSGLAYEIRLLPNNYVTSGTVFTNSEGNFNSINIWNIPEDYENYGKHKVEISYGEGKKSKNLTVEDNFIPEFGLGGLVLAAVLSILGILILRRN